MPCLPSIRNVWSHWHTDGYVLNILKLSKLRSMFIVFQTVFSEIWGIIAVSLCVCSSAGVCADSGDRCGDDDDGGGHHMSVESLQTLCTISHITPRTGTSTSPAPAIGKRNKHVHNSYTNALYCPRQLHSHTLMAVWHKASNNCWVAILILGLVTFSDLSDVTHVIQCVCVWSSLICVSVCVSVFILVEKNSKTYFGFLWLSISHSHDQLFDLTDEILTPAGCVLVMLVTSGYDMIYFALHLSQFIPDASLNINLNKQKQKTIFHKKNLLSLSFFGLSVSGGQFVVIWLYRTVWSHEWGTFHCLLTHSLSVLSWCHACSITRAFLSLQQVYAPRPPDHVPSYLQRERLSRLQPTYPYLPHAIIDLPPTIPLSDGEEPPPYQGPCTLQLRDPEQQLELNRESVRAPPNRTVFDGPLNDASLCPPSVNAGISAGRLEGAPPAYSEVIGHYYRPTSLQHHTQTRPGTVAPLMQGVLQSPQLIRTDSKNARNKEKHKAQQVWHYRGWCQSKASLTRGAVRETDAAERWREG